MNVYQYRRKYLACKSFGAAARGSSLLYVSMLDRLFFTNNKKVEGRLADRNVVAN